MIGFALTESRWVSVQVGVIAGCGAEVLSPQWGEQAGRYGR